MRRTVVLLLSGLLVAAGSFWIQAQDEEPTYETTLVKQWQGIQGKLLKMAEDTEYPDDKLDYKPHPDSRSYLEEIWHVTSSAQSVTVICKGEKPDYDKLFSDEGRPRNRAEFAAALKKANEESFEALMKNPTPRILGWVAHSAEHYGKLVGIYRENGIVPPNSRPKKGDM